MALSANSFPFLHELAAQAIDEARHIEVYRAAMKHLGYHSPMSQSIPKIFERIACTSNLPEKAVKGFLVLESLAVGLFGARVKLFQSSTLTSMDRLIVSEEVRHQSHAISVVSRFI